MSDDDLTPQERLLIVRRRHRLNQVEAAKQHGVSVRQYLRAERGHTEEALEMAADLLHIGPLSRLPTHEWLYLRRKRARITRQRMAKLAKCSPWWVTRMESGDPEAPPTRLEAAWARLDARRAARKARSAA